MEKVEEVKKLFVVSASPHIRSKHKTSTAMRIVTIALLPALVYSAYLYGPRVLLLTLISILAAVGAEAMLQRMLGKKISVADGSAVLTGLLLAYNLPPGAPWWLPAVGSAFAIIFAKQLFGGLGYNFINPALAGRAFLMASWPSLMTKEWLAPVGGTLSGIDGITAATPLSLLKNPANYGDPQIIVRQLNDFETIRNLFFGNIGGCIGETSVLFLLLGGLALLVLKIIDYRIVVGYLGSFALLAWLLPTPGSVLFHLFSGGLVLGAFFMATDWVTSPITRKGRWVFGIGCGVITIIIRLWGGYPEGVSYSILLMNVFTPLIDRLTKERIFGEQKRKGAKK
ncbi:MAG: RnfABCDGE type electron transport complex subunit D [candidate division WOR-3 bacterium]|nr:MAG: RnfABCDGE type electron transport complex subunit D [candidate division WOR-3 bacterium]